MNIVSIFEPYSNIITVISIFVTIVSLIAAKKEQHKRKMAEKALKSITWEDMQKASEKIGRELIKAYQPAVIYIPNAKSGIMLQFVRNYFKEYIPIIVGQTVSKEYFDGDARDKIKGVEKYWYVNTKKWHAYIPDILQEYSDRNILILDNLALTGDFLNTIKKELIQHGIPSDHIVTACIATTEAAIKDEVAPEYYYKKLTDSKTVYMPWGV